MHFTKCTIDRGYKQKLGPYDMTGFVYHYHHGNEPSLLYTYMMRFVNSIIFVTVFRHIFIPSPTQKIITSPRCRTHCQFCDIFLSKSTSYTVLLSLCLSITRYRCVGNEDKTAYHYPRHKIEVNDELHAPTA
jgi:hypothetical protein